MDISMTHLFQSDTELPEGFKMTELGPLPEEWKVVRLGDIFEETDRRVKDENEPDIPLLSITRYNGLVLQSQKFEKRVAGKDIKNYKVVRYGEMVYGFPMDEGVIHFLWNFDKGAVSPVYFTWRKKKDDADSHFLDYALKTPQMIEIYQLYTSRTVHRRRIVHPRDFKKINIPLPPLPEQRAIAHVLRTVQRAKEATERVIQATRELKKSLMRYLFTYGPVPIDEAEKVPLKETEIGLVPEHWEVVRLSEVANVRTSFPSFNLISKLDTGNQNDTFILALKVHDLNDPANQRYVQRARLYFRSNLSENRERFLKPRSIIFPKRGGAIATNKKRITKHYSILDPNLIGIEPQKVDEEYLFGFFLKLDLRTLQDNTPIPQLNKHSVESLLISLPPFTEQQKIAHILGVVEKKLQAEETRKQALETLFKTLLHNLMTGKVRVKDLLTEDGES